ncbi:MAG: hypothetical protein ACRCZW_01290 [Lactobacillaceae bacterium]
MTNNKKFSSSQNIGENYIPLRFKRSEQQRASKQSSSTTKSDQDISNIGMQKGTTGVNNNGF